jgi:hypothetical protein
MTTYQDKLDKTKKEILKAIETSHGFASWVEPKEGREQLANHVAGVIVGIWANRETFNDEEV